MKTKRMSGTKAFELLELPDGGDQAAIKSAHSRLREIWAPSRFPKHSLQRQLAEKKSIERNQAYRILCGVEPPTRRRGKAAKHLRKTAARGSQPHAVNATSTLMGLCIIALELLVCVVKLGGRTFVMETIADWVEYPLWLKSVSAGFVLVILGSVVGSLLAAKVQRFSRPEFKPPDVV